MTLDQIYSTYTAGSEGFCRAVETHCGYGISRAEIYRIAERAGTAEEFDRIWNHEDGWQDDE